MSTSSPLPTHNKVQELLQDFLAGYWSERTRANYAFIRAGWLSWCTAHNHDPLAQIDPAMLEGWIGELRARSYAPNTIAGASPPSRRSTDGASASDWCTATPSR